MADEHISQGTEHQHNNAARMNIDDHFQESAPRTFNEIRPRFKTKAKRPELSPDNTEPTEEHHTEKLQTEEQATENPPAEEEEVVEKMKKTKFSRKRFTKNEQEPKKRKYIHKRNRNLVDEETYKDKKAIIRNSPRLFSEMVYFLTDEQKNWAKKSGFEAILKFDLEMVPSKLSSSVVQIFDHKSVSLKIENGNIYITEEDVFDVFGLPFGGKPIVQKDSETTSRRMKEWLAQFPNDQITTARVLERIRAETRATELFKINFLTVLSNVLIGTHTHSYVDKHFMKFEDLDSCVIHNWAKFLIDYLVIAKESWNRTASEFFRGSQIFLTLLYVDRVMHRGKTLVDRKYPSFTGWTEEKFKERQAIEVLTGEFGQGKILVPLREHFSQSSQSQKSPAQPLPAQDKNDDGYHFNGNKHTDNEWTKRPQDKNVDNDDLCESTQWNDWEQENIGTDYDDYLQNIQETIENDDYDERFSENEDIENINVEDDAQCKEKETKDDESEKDDVEMLRLMASELINGKMKFEKEMMKALKKYPSNQQIQIIQEVYSDIFCPKNDSESNNKEESHEKVQGQLKTPEAEIVQQVCHDIRKEHEADLEDKDFLTPKPLLREKSTRQIKLGPYAKSPYIERVIDINGKYTDDDIVFWRYMMLQDRDKMEEVFVWKGVRCIREHIQTMYNNRKLYYSVIDTWSTILNDTENYKADESSMRLFCTIGGLNWSFDEKKKMPATYQIFHSNMDDMLSKYPAKQLKNIDMVFFPIYAHEHFYLICYNLKNPAYEIIDNILREEEGNVYYGKIPNILHSHFCKYLQCNGLPNLSKTIRKLKASYLKMSWQTQANSDDCGIFLMRHMETYKGDIKNWETGFRNELCGQYKQLAKLRTKYNNAILSSQINEKREEIISEAQGLFKDAAQQTIMKVGCTKARIAQPINKEKKKNVTFAENLTTRFQEA